MRNELIKDISLICNDKGMTPGPDYAMTAEVLKDGGKFIVAQLHVICQLVYENYLLFCDAKREELLSISYFMMQKERNYFQWIFLFH